MGIKVGLKCYPVEHHKIFSINVYNRPQHPEINCVLNTP